MNYVLPSIAACLAVVSLCLLSGTLALRLRAERLKQIVPVSVALAVGVSLVDTSIHLLSDVTVRKGSVIEVYLMILIGVFGFSSWRSGYVGATITMPTCRAETAKFCPWPKRISSAMQLHNLADGVLFVGRFSTEPLVGATATMAIIAHEVAQELGDVGALMRDQVAEFSLIVLLSVAAGCFIYIAASDPIPVLHERSTLSITAAKPSLFFRFGHCLHARLRVVRTDFVNRIRRPLCP